MHELLSPCGCFGNDRTKSTELRILIALTGCQLLRPSCSVAEALDRQESFVNAVLAQQALALLARLFRYGEILHHGAFVDVASSRSVPIAIDREHPRVSLKSPTQL